VTLTWQKGYNTASKVVKILYPGKIKMKSIIVKVGMVILLGQLSALAQTKASPEVLEKHRQAIELITRLRQIEEQTVESDDQLKAWRQQFRQRLREKLQANDEYIRLRKKLTEIKPDPSRKWRFSPGDSD